ncbi:MAG: hypothetical protein JWO57_364, partial [Pseudonocardiales bacterium]|nr:hypothetical protein [Pseudonocardiales bacterium]
MDATTTIRIDAASVELVEPQWLSALAWEGLKLGDHGPEMDYGMRWGASGGIRVSYAPFRDAARDGRGFVYAYDAQGDRYLLLNADTTVEQVDNVWGRFVAEHTDHPGTAELVQFGREIKEAAPTGYSVDRATQTLLHFLDRELSSNARLTSAGPDRCFEDARQVVIDGS